MSEATYKRVGDTIEEAGIATAVTAGQMAQKATLAAFATHSFAIGDKAVYRVAGVIALTMEASGAAGAVGAEVWFDASANTGSLVPKYDTGDFRVGVLTLAVDASATTAYVLLNEGAESLLRITEGKTVETKSANYTLDAQDVGKVILVDTDAFTLTLPATVVGYEYIIMNGGKSGAVLITVSPNASDAIMGPDIAGVANKDYLNTKATAEPGDYLLITGDGADGWFANKVRGTWAQEA